MRWAKTGAVALCAAAMAPAAAQAATVTLEAGQDAALLRYEAAPGETNRPLIAYDALTRTVRVTDAVGTTLQAGATPAGLGTCAGAGPAVVCTPEPYLEGAVIRLGDGADAYTQDVARVDVDGGAGSDVLAGTAGRFAGGDGDDDLTGVSFAACCTHEDSDRVFAYGDAGDDSFRGAATASGFGGKLSADGGPGDDTLLGSNFGDRWTGGTGADESSGRADVSYAGHPAGVHVTLDGIADDGAPGEGDLVRDTHEVTGSAFADTLEAGTADATLRGGAGDDVLTGGAGPDTLHGDAGNDELDGGANWDQVHGGAGHDTVTGGAGPDHLYGGDGYGGSGDDVFHAADGEEDQILQCGFGADTAYADSFDDFNLLGWPGTCTQL